MAETPSRDVLEKVRKLARLPEELRQSKGSASVTRLTTLKGLCQDHEVASRFVTFLARKTLARVKQDEGRYPRSEISNDRVHRQMMSESLVAMDDWIKNPTEARRSSLQDVLGQIKAEHNRFKRVHGKEIRVIADWDLLLFERALSCLVRPAGEAGFWAYEMARDYADRYESGQGDGLTSSSIPLLQDIIEFWTIELELDEKSFLEALSHPAKTEPRPSSTRAKKSPHSKSKKISFTHRQGQFLAFIHQYWKMHRQAPAELDLVKFFRVTPPSAHGMITKLSELGLITKEPRVPRSIRIAIPEEEIPELECVEGRAW